MQLTGIPLVQQVIGVEACDDTAEQRKVDLDRLSVSAAVTRITQL